MNTTTNHIGILIIGDEILSGRRQDKHLQKIIETLHPRGLQLSWARYCGDDIENLTQQFIEIKQQGHLCFSFGGIGATVDDLTRQSIAKAHGLELKRNPEATKEIETQFGSGAYPNRILMADIPEGAEIIPNPYNRIPGFYLGNIYCLPGFPQMAWPMMEWILNTKYQHLTRAIVVEHALTLQNVHESDLIELLDLIQNEHPLVKIFCLPTLAKIGHSQIELGVKGIEHEVNETMTALKNALLEQGLTYS